MIGNQDDGPSGPDSQQEEPDIEEWADEDNPDPYALALDVEDESGTEHQDDDGDDDEPDDVAGEREGFVERGSVEVAPKALISLYDAVACVEASGVQFQLDSDEKRHSMYLLAGTPEDGVGPKLADAIYFCLRAAGIRVLRRGVGGGIARGGRHYNFYFRIEREDGSLPARAEVRSALRGASENTNIASAQLEPNKALGGETATESGQADMVVSLESAHAELRRVLSRAAQAERLALGAAHIVDRRLVAYRRRLSDVHESSIAQLRRLTTSAPTDESRLLREELQAAQEKVLELDKEIDTALEWTKDEALQRQKFEAEAFSYRTENIDLHARLSALKKAADHTELNEDLGGRDQLVRALLPEVHFFNDSLAVMWLEMDRFAWLRLLTIMVHDHSQFCHELHQTGYLKAVQGKADWKEARRSKSPKNMERMYFSDAKRHFRGPKEIWVVSFDMKANGAQQSRHIDSLP